MEEYTLDDLVIMFERHAKKFEEEEKKRRMEHEMEYGEPVSYEYFNLASALCCMCKEIKKIRSES